MLLERRGNLIKRHFQLCFKPWSHRTREPVYFHAHLVFLSGSIQHFRNVYLDFQSVRLHCFYSDGMFERLPSPLETCLPIARLGIFCRCGVVNVNAGHRLSNCLAFKHLPWRRYQFHRHGVICRQRFQFVFNHKSEVNIVAGTPHATLTINKCLNTFFILRAAYVKSLCWEFRATVNFEICSWNTVCCHNYFRQILQW